MFNLAKQSDVEELRADIQHIATFLTTVDFIALGKLLEPKKRGRPRKVKK